jgi:hypothetical protein
MCVDMDRRMVEFAAMQVSATDAKGQLTEPVSHADAGDEVALDRQGRMALLKAALATGAAKAKAGPIAARSQDFLYGDDGLSV